MHGSVGGTLRAGERQTNIGSNPGAYTGHSRRETAEPEAPAVLIFLCGPPPLHVTAHRDKPELCPHRGVLLSVWGPEAASH